jgi:hypothetical protein
MMMSLTEKISGGQDSDTGVDTENLCQRNVLAPSVHSEDTEDISDTKKSNFPIFNMVKYTRSPA